MTYAILTYGDRLLRRRAEPVERIDATIRALAADMLKTMYAAEGIGLAAAQIGRPEAMCVIDIPPARDPETGAPRHEHPGIAMPLVMLNPRILKRDGRVCAPEGCLSFPDIQVAVARAETVNVTFTNLDGREETATVSGLLARAVQHELDHLDGVLLVDHMSTVQKAAHAGRLRRLRRG